MTKAKVYFYLNQNFNETKGFLPLINRKTNSCNTFVLPNVDNNLNVFYTSLGYPALPGMIQNRY